jgi:GNAT superfamily N-acetyltransferase
VVDDRAVTVRPAVASDAGLLEAMLVEAIGWDPARTRMEAAVVLGFHENKHYVEGWPRLDDVGVVAEDASGTPVGAAWLRFFTAADPGYGFIADGIPEVTLGVVADRRGEGIGTRLLAALEDEARRREIRTLGLSVEPANPARRLYERRGYRRVGGSGDAHTMRLDL